MFIEANCDRVRNKLIKELGTATNEKKKKLKQL
jgi:hypothetical protein